MKTIRNASPADASRCFEIESCAYGGDEAATLEKVGKRIAEYPEGFLILEIEDKIIGFINSGCAHEVVMSDEDFKDLVGHASDAPNVVIMSVVVDPAHQGKGYSTAMMNEFIARMVRMEKKSIHLMCRDRHVPLYERFGYRYTKPSTSGHGGVKWHEMIMTLSG